MPDPAIGPLSDSLAAEEIDAWRAYRGQRVPLTGTDDGRRDRWLAAMRALEDDDDALEHWRQVMTHVE